MTDLPRPTSAKVIGYASPGRTRVARPPRPPVVWIVLFGLLLFPLTVVLAYPIAWLLPVGCWTIAETKLTTTWTDEFGSPITLFFRGDGPGRGRSVPMVRATVGSGGFVLNVNLEEKVYYPVADVDKPQNTKPLTLDAVEAELRLARLDQQPGESAQLAADIMAELSNFRAGRLPPSEKTFKLQPPPYHAYVMAGTNWPPDTIWWPWYTPWCVPIWLIAWVLLAKWLLRRHRRRLAAFHERSPS
jgi:hypothetical protein